MRKARKPSLEDALGRIEASAAYLTSGRPMAQALGSDELRDALRRIRDIAQEALGIDPETNAESDGGAFR